MSVSVLLDGKRIELSDQDYLSGGGQATVYLRGDTVYKVYDQEPAPDFEQKLQLLIGLGARPTIVAPQKLLYSRRHRLAGYTMGYAEAPYALAKLFTTSFQRRNGLDGNQLNHLVSGMIETIGFVHDQGMVMVDGNEFNYLVSRDFRSVFFIDVDGYQTPSHPATVIMPSIRDWLSPSFTKETDWFSFAVVATQLYLGIHPFRGTWQTNPELRDLKERVLQRISVFHPDVTLPAATRPLATVPKNFRQWLIDTFEQGLRSRPPLPQPDAVAVVVPAALVPALGVSMTEVRSYPAELLDLALIAGRVLATTRDRVFVDSPSFPRPAPNDQTFFALNQLWTVWLDNELHVRSLTGPAVEVDTSSMARGQPVVMDHRLFIVVDGSLVETQLLSTGSGTRLLTRQRWPLSRHSSQPFDGGIAVDHLGATFLAIPLAEGSCGMFRVPSLDGHRLVNGRFHQRVAMMVSSLNDQSFVTELHLDEARGHVVLEAQRRVDRLATMNFVVLKGSVLAVLTDEGVIELSVVGREGKKIVGGGEALRDGELRTDGTTLFLQQNRKLLRLTMA